MLRRMAQSKHRRKGRNRLPATISSGKMSATLSPEFRTRQATPGVSIPDERELRDALATIPDDFDWDWARTRLVPLFERGGAEGTVGDPMINALTSLGVGIGFGIEIGPMLARVTKSMAQRWETSVEQIEHVAFDNLQRAVAEVDRRDLQPAVFNGHMLRALPNPQGWASSVILAGEAAVTRIFGEQDQIFTTPTRGVLLAFDAQVPMRAVMDVTVALEELDPHPLMLEPFVLRDGGLIWAGTVSDEELD